MTHVEPTDRALIVISTEHLLAELRIANLANLPDIKPHFVSDLFLDTFREMGFQNLLRQRTDKIFVLTQQRIVLLIKPTGDVILYQFSSGWLSAATRRRTKLVIL